MNKLTYILIIPFLFSCSDNDSSVLESNKITTHIEQKLNTNNKVTETSLIILGTIQDAGSPQIGCVKKCCKGLFQNPDNNRKVVSIGVIDPQNKKKYIFEASPDFVSQTKLLKKYCDFETAETPDGIFLTHAHIGHYTGLMYLGKEAMSAKNALVYAMPKMKIFLEENGPWSQLVKNNNISINALEDNIPIQLTENLEIVPITVPHRDEFSETVGYVITGPNKSALFIPDIDKWGKWNTNIIEAISKVDYAFLDATFYDGEEINNRNISDIPHPFIIESMEKFKGLSAEEKKKIYFIHFNHTNPVINIESKQAKQVIKNGFNIAQINTIFKL
ncbi:MAG: pyrroloquinoline quinone biosynthesis protein PqqB [Flavobacteriales bacterium]|nr:MAG: pyrroloquinoline quinone biosynthesis protein PqqB [Flavobacteriales bacterium]